MTDPTPARECDIARLDEGDWCRAHHDYTDCECATALRAEVERLGDVADDVYALRARVAALEKVEREAEPVVRACADCKPARTFAEWAPCQTHRHLHAALVAPEPAATRHGDEHDDPDGYCATCKALRIGPYAPEPAAAPKENFMERCPVCDEPVADKYEHADGSSPTGHRVAPEPAAAPTPEAEP